MSFKDHLVQPPCNELGHLHLDLVAQSPVFKTRGTTALLSSTFKNKQGEPSHKYFSSGIVVLYTQMPPRTSCSAALCCSCAAAQCLSDFPLSWIFMKNKISLGRNLLKKFLPWELLTSYFLSDFTPSSLYEVKNRMTFCFPEKQCRKASSYRHLNIFFYVCTVQFKRILNLHVTLPPLKGCSKPGGQDAVIAVALFCWRKSSKDEKHQREQQSDRDCEEWLLGHVWWYLLAMHVPSAEGKASEEQSHQVDFASPSVETFLWIF